MPMSTPVRTEGARHVLGRPRQLSETRLDGRYACRVQPAGSRTTLSSVAAAAGVSLATVSKVVNDRHDVAPATRERVRRLLEQHNYNRPGRRRGRSRTVGLVMRALDSEWAVEIIRGVTGSELDVVVSTMPAGAAAATWAEDVAASARAGVIVVTSQFTSAQKRVFQRAGIPCVVIDPVDLPDPDVPSVGATNWDGGLAATRHLARARAPADRDDRRTGRRAVRAGADRRLPRRAGRGRPAVRPRAGPGRHLPARRRVRRGERAARPARPADRDLRRQRRAGVRRDRGGPGGRPAPSPAT